MSILAKANIMVLAVVILGAAIFLARPSIATYLWGAKYKTAMFQCDNVMREHLVAKTAMEASPGVDSLKNLKAAELGLVDCHGYDKLRKKLIAWGLDSNDLSMLGLEALEEESYELQRYVEVHEIRY
ncbi:MAG: TIGR03982 family His-Xaa-Ser system protein [Woeseia sp.]